MKYEKICDHCGAPFSTNNKRDVFCSEGCSTEGVITYKTQNRMVTDDQRHFLIAFVGKAPEEIAKYDSYKALQVIGEFLENRKRQKV